MQSVDPFTGEIIQTYREYTWEEVNLLLQDVETAYRRWRLTDFAYRATLMKKLQAKLTANRESLALLMVSEMGKVKREALGEIDKCALVCGFYAENCDRRYNRCRSIFSSTSGNQLFRSYISKSIIRFILWAVRTLKSK